MMLSEVAAKMGDSAVFGFGASAGRDAWKSFKKNFFFIILLLATIGLFVFPFLAFKTRFQGEPLNDDNAVADRNSIVYLHIFGFLVCAALLVFVIWMADTDSRDTGSWPEIWPVYTGVAAVFSVSAVIGMFVGKLIKPGRMAKFQIIAENNEFMERHGFIETGEEEITHYDGDGVALRFMEKTDHRIVFMAVGRRNKRAYINLSDNGAMMSYSGVISLAIERA